MLELVIPAREFFDEETETFFTTQETRLNLEHSLVSLSKWESKHKKPFISSEKTAAELIDYVRCMTITQNVKPEAYAAITPDLLEKVIDYISDPMTATWFNDKEGAVAGSRRNEIITAELIYYWMISLQIPMECQRWHLNRLLTLVKVCSIKNTPEKKMSKRDLINRNRSLNNARRAAMRSKG